MERNLSLVLEKPVEELIPAMISFNNDELLAQVTQMLKTYDGVEYSEEQISEAKADRAKLNAFVKALNDERIRIKKVYEAPYEKFKSQVDEVSEKVEMVSKKISAQLDQYEKKRIEKKTSDIEEYFNSVIGDFSGVITFESVFDKRWTNASVPMKQVASDIERIIENAINAFAAIEALHSPDENALKTYYCKTLDLASALVKNDELREARERIEHMNAARQAQVTQEAKKEVSECNFTSESQKAQETQNLMVVRFECAGTIEQMRALKDFLVGNDIQYKKI